MRELNNNIDVSDFAVDFVMEQAHVAGSERVEPKRVGFEETRLRKQISLRVVTLKQLAPAIALWKYLQFEQEWIDKRWAEFDADHDGLISVDELQVLLTRLNEGINVTDKEAAWVLNEIDSDHCGHLKRSQLRAGACVLRVKIESLATSLPQIQTKVSARAAVALWYPRIYNRRNLDEINRTADDAAGRKRRALVAQIFTLETEVADVCPPACAAPSPARSLS